IKVLLEMPTYVRYVLRRTQYAVDHSDGNGLNSSPTRTEKTRQQAPLTFKPAEPISVGVEAQNEIVCVAPHRKPKYQPKSSCPNFSSTAIPSSFKRRTIHSATSSPKLYGLM